MSINQDPRNIANIGEFTSMGEKSKKKYTKTWLEFCDDYNISVEKMPEEKDFLDYLGKKKQNGHSFKFIMCLQSHLNKACVELYNWKLNKWPSIYELIKSTKPEEKETTKSHAYYQEFCSHYNISEEKPITEEDLLDYFTKMKDSGMKYTTMKIFYNHINVACNEVNGWNLEKWPNIFNFIKTSAYSAKERKS